MTLENKYATLMGLYRSEKPLVRFHIRVRYRRALLDELVQYVPESGSVLEIGCGHGAFANLLSLTSDRRRITGIDVAENKIATAQRTVGDRANISFLVADALNYLPREKPDAIVIMETLYLIPYDEQETMLRTLAGRLAPDGVLIFTEACRDASFAFRRVVLQETISVKLLRITAGKRLYFRSEREWTALLDRIGLSARVIRRRTPNPTYLFLCRKKAQ